jgi:hypothetical protein
MMPARKIGTPACHRRSPDLSECQPLSCCVANPARYGSPASTVARKSLTPESRFTIVGNQNANPYPPLVAKK